MSRRFADHFSAVAGDYSAFRPRYPASLFGYLAGLAPKRRLAWDAAAGSGQATLDLAAHFDHVVATDASAAQLAAAPRHPKIEYRVARAERGGLPAGSVDLVIVAQALHWLDRDRFFAEARRVLTPGGIIAVWSYDLQRTGQAPIDQLLERFYRDVVGPYWPAERRLVEEGYRTIPFPFEEIEPPRFEMAASWDLTAVLGYIGTWSATCRYRAAREEDPVRALGEQLAPIWGQPRQKREVTWPLALRVGRSSLTDRAAA